MTLSEFVNKYNGVHIDEDGYYGAQCWDVSARYAREVVGCPSFPTGSGGAEGLFRLFANPIPQYFDRIANNKSDPNQLPLPGDVIVWDASFSPPWGHTAVCISADASGVNVIEQNGNNPGGVAYIKKRGWTGVSGWLRPKKGTTMAVIPDADNYYWRYGQKLAEQLRGRQLSRDEFRQHIVGQTDLRAVEILADDPEADQAQNWQNVGRVAVTDKWDQQIYNLQDQLKNQATAYDGKIAELNTSITTLNTKVDELVKVLSIKDGEIDRLSKENAELNAKLGDNNLTVKQAINILWKTITDAIKGK
ncbi:CHAP domain-containing protein [bacterium]|nr:CHAP domain-containing protein [bacterium]NDC95745.1 CHAP domain-containing protein [bacterium]NDD85842.1 CHAP domain-containing protein [bacterium]